MDYVSWILRLIMPFIALAIVIRTFVSLRYNRRNEGALIVLEDEDSQKVYPVKYWETSIGRSRGSDVRLTNPMVSRDHAVLLRREAGWFVTDTGSKAGVTVNDKPITGRTAVYIGDRINIGGTILVVRRADDYGDNSQEEHCTKKSKPPKRTIAPSFLLFLVTLFTIMFAAEICINLENLDVAPIAAVYIVFMWVFFIVTMALHKASDF